MKKIRKTVFAVALMLIICAFVAPAAHATTNGWAWQQEVAHQIAELARSLGLSENHPVIVVCQDLWWAYHDGSNPNVIGTYTSYRTGATYTYGYSNNGSAYSDYFDGTYYWFYNSSNGRYYRYDRNGNTIWGDYGQQGSTYGTIDTTYAYTERKDNLSGYYSNWKGINLYAGRIYGLRGFNIDEVETLARLINSYAPGKSSLIKSAVAWVAFDLMERDENTLNGVINKYLTYYDSKAEITEDDREFAREMLFRRAAKQAGLYYVGQTLADGHGWIHDDGCGNIYFRKSRDGANYTFPYANDSTKSDLRSPY